MNVLWFVQLFQLRERELRVRNATSGEDLSKVISELSVDSYTSQVNIVIQH